ncbi:MAG: hypothetical protein ACXVLQ_04760 [Bacteriovorax sp.]
MLKWITFFKERTPLASYLLITMGPATSGYYLAKNPNFYSLFLAFFGFFLFFLVLRMMDEYKDYEKDVLAHPTRPLPRGLIPLFEFKKGITTGIALLVLFDFFLLLSGYKCSFYLFSLVIIHLWFMYKEFYVAEWINARPILYAITHQLILVSLCLYCLSTFRKNEIYHFSLLDWVYSLSVLFAFFSYEVCRKLDPSAHPVLKTYRYVYGMNGVMKIVGVLALMHLISIHFYFQNSPKQYLFYVPILLLLSGLFALTLEKIKFKLVELLATLNLLIFLYSGIFYVITN